MWHLPQRVYKWLWSRMEVGEINKAAVRRRGLHYEVILRGFIRRENESAANAPSLCLSCLNLLSSTRREQEGRVSPPLHQLQPCPFLPSPWNYISYKWPCTGAFWSKHPNAWDRYVYPGQWRTAIPLRLLKSSWLHLASQPSRGRESKTPGYDGRPSIIYTGELERLIVSEEVGGQRHSSGQCPFARARTSPLQASALDGRRQGAAAIQWRQSWNESTEGLRRQR